MLAEPVQTGPVSDLRREGLNSAISDTCHSIALLRNENFLSSNCFLTESKVPDYW
jgi:hypothetical protein